MKNIPTLLFFIASSLALLLLLKKQQQYNNLQKEAGFQVTFQSISSILRAQLQYVQSYQNLIYTGDSVGSLTTWTFDSKKKKLAFLDISRTINPQLPSQNPVLGIIAHPQGAMALTGDGKIKLYQVNSTGKILNQISLQISQSLKQIKLINDTNFQKVVFAGINKASDKICIYSLNEGFEKPNPVSQVSCNSSLNGFKYNGLAYDDNNSLLSVGDQSRAILFLVNLSESVAANKLKYLCEAFLPKAEVAGFESVFAKTGTLIAINDLWVSSIIIDLTVPSAKVLSSIRTQKLIKTGLTNNLAVNKDNSSKTTLVMINSKNKMEGYTLQKNQKLTSQSQSKIIGSPKYFTLHDDSTMFAIQDCRLTVVGINSNSSQEYFKVEDSIAIASDNHFQPVIGFGFWNNTLISTSDGGQNNFKIWNYDPKTMKITLVDQKTFRYFSILSSGQNGFPAIEMMPPPQKSNANATLHIAVAGNNPYSINIVVLSTQGKISHVYSSNQSHYNNITSLYMTPDQQKFITSSFDSNLKVWPVSSNRSQMSGNATVVVTKNGPITQGVSQKSRTYFVYAHTSTFDNKLVNISLWKLDSKKGAIKIAQNVPSEAHYSNLTALVLSQDEQYLISLSQNGEMRLWQHSNWTIIDLLASLSLGDTKIKICKTESNRILLESETEFLQYSFDFVGFALIGRVQKQYKGIANSTMIVGKTLFSGDRDGSIRIYSLNE